MTQEQMLLKIAKLTDDFHEAGVLEPEAFDYLIDSAKRYPIKRSAETGCGVSTLALSWLSREHLVFTLSHYGSIPAKSYFNVSESGLLEQDAVEFILGPTQQTLPNHEFDSKLDLVLLDGPHGFPFPQIEYYYFYPRIAHGGLLIIDDIHIPTVRWLYDFLCDDDMFTLDKVVCNTAFFQRSEVETFNPLGDDWWLQGYNQKRFKARASIKQRLTQVARRIM